MSRPLVSPRFAGHGGTAPTRAPWGLAGALPWALTAAAVLVQITYPLVPGPLRAHATILSVVVFCAAALTDTARVHGLRGAAVLLAVAGGGGLLVEAVGVHTGVPFGTYAYTGDLGTAVLGVPLVVPLAWTMMAWPALVVGRALRRRWPVALVGGLALTAWDLFLDPQMVDAGYWTWAHPLPALPLVPGVPLSNYAGWLVVSVVVVGALDRLLPPHARPPGPAAALYLWTYGSSVLAHVVFFGRPGSALVGGLVMGSLALPFAWVLYQGTTQPVLPHEPAPVRPSRAQSA